ncbi:LysR family transcriptional regulator [Gluconacetobacter liquefaciens]|uniref:DNA-binding transcriptional LysR family regulator n=1 Tax=Gluconacetobacter liquefaciens TaxID=89584 RepID=A0A370G4D2_GLULI|nr:LysR family transcriptional regulator [Gluconacetobacter liquefaciens]MBB2186123.1 LysR family transcriptional regulator [Gluconacetobacter liquefaciens]RDI38658.1 DNA-binding transcriptional LysR family regulator [Gluconacetobacter liquefaciens]GBQ95242.1 LysR family transcriptional regulator [Gluconacetobacter liquefaciens NRIC 0522]GEB37074.1 LysR family transcriptional regulator [Gluconacetobacter liquefaciens]
MTLEQLRLFIAVAEREHMTAGARALNVTQSAASAAIAALEERHGVKLFHRVGRGITLTEAGRLFLTEARAVLARATAAEHVLDDLGALRRGTLRIVASQTIAAYWLPALLAAFRHQYPALSVDLTIRNTEQAAAQVHDGEADIGIVEGAIDDPALAHWPIGEDRLLLVQAEPFPDTPITAAWMQQARWIMREEGSGTRSTLNQHLRRLGIAPDTLDIALVLPSNESVRTAVEAGAGIAALSSLVVAPGIRAGILHAAPFSFGPRPFFGLRHKERYRSRAAEALLAFITAHTGVAPGQ